VIQGELTGLDTTDEKGSPYDVYSFQAVAGQEVRITLRSSEFDTYLSLFDASDPAAGLAVNDDGAGGTDAGIVFPVQFTGEYLVRAGSFYAGSRGHYRLDLTIR